LATGVGDFVPDLEDMSVIGDVEWLVVGDGAVAGQNFLGECSVFEVEFDRFQIALHSKPACPRQTVWNHMGYYFPTVRI